MLGKMNDNRGETQQLRERMLRALERLPIKVVVGLSGGVDSVALLHGLRAVGREVVVAHFNHGWRSEADADEAFCRGLAEKKYGVSFYAEKAVDEEREAREEVGRRARFVFFRRVCEAVGVWDVVLGHHADDLVETYLMQLFRGGGVRARGMVEVMMRDGMRIWRPWLGVWREEVEMFAREEGLKWRDDESNADVRYRRNWIRHVLIPLLEREGGYKEVRRALWRSARVMADRGEWIEGLVKRWREMETLAVDEIKGWPVGMQREVVYGWLKERGVRDVSFKDVEDVLGLLVRDKPPRVNVAGELQVYRRAGRIGVRRQVDEEEIKG